MEPPAQKRAARFALLALSLLGLLWLARLDYDRKISTNIIDLIPRDERSPELALVRSLVGDRQAQAMLFALRSGEGPAPSEAANQFAEHLRKSGLFRDVVVLSDTASRDALGGFVYERRFDLLLPQWLEEKQNEFAATGRPMAEFSAWLAERTVDGLDKFVGQPESVAFQELLPNDPFLLVPTLADRAQALGFGGGSGSTKAALIWGLIRPSPFAEEGQQPVFHAVDTGLAALHSAFPGVELQWTGINRFAAESRRRISAEMSWLNAISLIAVLTVALVFVRRLWKVIHLVPVILFSILGAWVIATIAFERLHILVFVVGSLLTGVAIDYGFYLYMQPALRPDEPYREKLGRLLKPLLTSCLTTVIGFSFLLWSELPLIRQLGIFVSGGLVSALIGAILYFAQLERAFLETRTLPRPETVRARLLIRFFSVVTVAAALFGLSRLSWRDDIRQLEVPSVELRTNDVRVRNLFGDTEERALFITRGGSVAEAREALDRFLHWHDARYPEAPGASLGWLIPTRSAWNALPQRLIDLGSFERDLRETLERRSYTATGFDPFFEAWRGLAARSTSRPGYEQLADDVLSRLSGPLSLLLSNGKEGAWFLTLANHPSDASPPAEFSTFPVAQLESLNTLFSRYRSSALRLSAMGLGLVGASVFVLYGFRRGIRIFAIPAGSCVIAFGLLGLMGQPLNLFHLLGAFLGVCLSHNYAIFSAENSGRREPPPPSIRLSALTAASSFGVLAFSKIPVVSALGTIVAIIVLTALLMVELEPLAGSASTTMDKPASQ